MDIKEIQNIIYSEYFERDNARGLFPTFAWFVEEVGELAEALLKGDRELIEEEIADVLAWLVSIANLLNIDVERAFIKKYIERKS